jgi:Lon protease-like protein
LRELSLSDLEGELAIFPLPGALLLPRGRLPLNIFEPRYITMIDDALRSRRLIGMLQPQGVEADDEDDETEAGAGDETEAPEERSRFAMPPRSAMIARETPPALYHVGCVGRLTSFVEREDGTYAVTLAGITRFRVRQELDPVHGYRRVMPEFGAFANDLVEPGPVAFNREALIVALRRFFAQRGFEARWDAIEQMDDETLIITLSMICPFAGAEKQALLEAVTLSQRAQTLLALLQMAGHETDDGRKPHAV